MNEQNLKKDFTRAERQANGRKGAAITNAKKTEKKQLKEIFDAFLQMNAPQEMKDKATETLPELKNERLSLKAALVVCLIEKIISGDMKAFEIMRDTIGEKPVDKLAHTDSEGKDIPPAVVSNPELLAIMEKRLERIGAPKSSD